MNTHATKQRVGEARPSQILFTYGVGAIVDLPNIAALVMGLEDWAETYAPEIGEERLLAAVREQLGSQVERLRGTPYVKEDWGNPFDQSAQIGVPVAPFPRWMVCPYCRLLAPLKSGLFKLKVDQYHADRTRYVHENCSKPGPPPAVLPARFLVACKAGHLDDFPWSWFVHMGAVGCETRLRLREYGVSGEAADVEVICETCGKRRRMSDAFGPDSGRHLPRCSGRWPHLREYAEGACGEDPRAILLGASNFWFPISLSALAIPTAQDPLSRLVEEHWLMLSKVDNIEELRFLRHKLGQLPMFAAEADDGLMAAIEAHRAGQDTGGTQPPSKLRVPEWQVFSAPDPALTSKDFRLRPVLPPARHAARIEQVVLVERMRQVRALIGFTRIESPGDLADIEDLPPERRAPLARKEPRWVPAAEVRGEGLFIRFREEAVAAWEAEAAVAAWGGVFYEAHSRWRRSRRLAPAGNNFPGMRYILLHSFSHALMRRLAIECGYSAAGISERIYALPALDEDGPMAGVLIYTAAADSEGTLGGLVSLGEPEALGRLIDLALEEARLCSSDPLCAEHLPGGQSLTLHGAACHSCLFAPETACERGNKYLDRSLLVEPVFPAGRAFFPVT